MSGRIQIYRQANRLGYTATKVLIDGFEIPMIRTAQYVMSPAGEPNQIVLTILPSSVEFIDTTQAEVSP